MTVPGLSAPKSARGLNSGTFDGDRRASAFTLVEMLVVVAILLTVSVVALPAITSLSKSGARRGAVGQMLGVLDQARAIALVQGGNIFVAFADGDPAIPQEYRYRAYAIFRETYYPEHRETQPYVMELVRPWTQLPEGIALRAVATEGSVFEGPKRSFPFWLGATGKAGTATGTAIDLPYLRFNGVGMLEKANGQPWEPRHSRLMLFEGFVNEDGTTVATSQGAEEVLLLSTVTGRAKREEREDAS